MSTSDEGVFYFRAGAPEGGVFSGQLRSRSSEEAVATLRERGFQPLRLELRPIRDSWLHREVAFGSAKRLSATDCEVFCRELALLLESGIAILDATVIARSSQSVNSLLARFITAVGNGLRLGRSLSQAIESSGYAVPSDLVPVVSAGEQSGSLVAALRMLSETYSDTIRFARAYSSALAYPVLLLTVSILVFGLIGFFVAPNLAGLFTSMDRPVPFAIAVLSTAAAFVSGNLLPIGSGAVIAVLALGAAGANGRASRTASVILFRAPVIGSALRWSAGRRFASALRLYLSSNVPVATALPNALMAAGFPSSTSKDRLITKVREGERLSSSLSASGLLPAKLVHIISVGESSGRLVDVLGAVIAEATNRFEQRVSLVSTLLAPILILLVGVMIGTVLFSVFSALLEINEVAL
jgi:type II secretory pathway component PulF